MSAGPAAAAGSGTKGWKKHKNSWRTRRAAAGASHTAAVQKSSRITTISIVPSPARQDRRQIVLVVVLVREFSASDCDYEDDDEDDLTAGSIASRWPCHAGASALSLPV